MTFFPLRRTPKILLIAAVSIAALAMILLAGALMAWPTLESWVRTETIHKLEERFDGTAELGSLSFSLCPSPGIEADGIVIRHEGRTDLPPLINIQQLTAGFTIWGLLQAPLRVGQVELEGLEISISDDDSDGRGGVVERVEGQDKAIQLDVEIRQGRIEDLITLVAGQSSPIVGQIEVQTKFELPGGEKDVIDRLRLDGRFRLQRAEFTGDSTREKLRELSWRARGRPDRDEDSVDRIVSDTVKVGGTLDDPEFGLDF